MKDHDQEIRKNQRKKMIRRIIVERKAEIEDLNPKIDIKKKMMETRTNTKKNNDKEMRKRNKKTQKEPNP